MITNENFSILGLIIIYIIFFVLLYPITCILLSFNIAKKPKSVRTIRGILSLGLEIMLSHFKVCFISWIISAGLGGLLAFISLIVVGIFSKWFGNGVNLVDPVVFWVQFIVIAIGQIVGYIISIFMHNADVRD